MHRFAQSVYFRKNIQSSKKWSLLDLIPPTLMFRLRWVTRKEWFTSLSNHFAMIFKFQWWGIRKWNFEPKKTPPRTDRIIMKRIKNCCAKSYSQIIFLTELQDLKENHWLWSAKKWKSPEFFFKIWVLSETQNLPNGAPEIKNSRFRKSASHHGSHHSSDSSDYFCDFSEPSDQ